MNELLIRLQPLAYTVIVIAIIISFAKSIFKGDFKNLVWQIIICGIVAYIVYDPIVILNLGKFVVDNGMKIGGDIVGATQETTSQQ